MGGEARRCCRGGHGGGGRKKDEGDEEGEAEERRPASRTKTQVHIQGDVGRCPEVTSIKDGLPLTAAAPAPGRTVQLPTDGPRYACPDDHLVTAALSRISQLGLRERRSSKPREKSRCRVGDSKWKMNSLRRFYFAEEKERGKSERERERERDPQGKEIETHLSR